MITENIINELIKLKRMDINVTEIALNQRCIDYLNNEGRFVAHSNTDKIDGNIGKFTGIPVVLDEKLEDAFEFKLRYLY